ncbi:hypothetical protein EDB19DRAFT_2037010 [Suillus lakei]|nr:hypothetical protein EDB19DRAFT_2037010 [Suillus lakei]
MSSELIFKGTAFTKEERKDLGLTGRLPSRVNTIEEQCERTYDQLRSRESPIQKNSFLQSLKEQNWVLYYSLLSRHLKELTSIIYTPTEKRSQTTLIFFVAARGLFLTFLDQDSMEEDFLEQTRGKDIELMVCTDALLNFSVFWVVEM